MPVKLNYLHFLDSRKNQLVSTNRYLSSTLFGIVKHVFQDIKIIFLDLKCLFMPKIHVLTKLLAPFYFTHLNTANRCGLESRCTQTWKKSIFVWDHCSGESYGSSAPVIPFFHVWVHHQFQLSWFCCMEVRQSLISRVFEDKHETEQTFPISNSPRRSTALRQYSLDRKTSSNVIPQMAPY